MIMNKKNDNYYDSKHDTNLVIKRISGVKFFRKRKKLTELKNYYLQIKFRTLLVIVGKVLS